MTMSAKLYLLFTYVFLSSIELLPTSQAKVVPYTLDVYYISGAPDGIHKDKILGINGQFPGPTLEANVGDTLKITVINSIQDSQNTSIHWHGIHQQGSLFEDGSSMITQCPLPPGQSMVYRFKVTQAGTYWYHSHVNSQYTEGMFGALVVRGSPEAYKYDGEFTLMLSDWYHQTAHENEAWHLSPPSRGVPPYPNSGLINGMGRYPCEFARLMNRTCDMDQQFRPVIKLHRDKLYRIRLLNTAAVASFNFSVDYHTLRAIEVDGIDVAQPVSAHVVPIAAGQRYSFLFQCKDNAEGKNESRYLIRANLRTESLMLIEGVNINKYPEALMSDMTAVIECVDGGHHHRGRNPVEMTREKFTCVDIVPPYGGSNDLEYIDEMKLVPLDGIPVPDYFDQEFMVNADFHEDHENIRRGSFNRTPFVLPNDKPLLMQLLDGKSLPDNVMPLEINYGSVVQLVINNPFFGPHPFHLHGHHFWILGMGGWYDGSYDPTKHNLTIHGVKRDTVLVQEQSWAVIRFVADNPGVWMFHCHIDWHVLSGMALMFVEGADIVRNTTKISDEALRVCKMHGHYHESQNDNEIVSHDIGSNILHYHSPHHH